MNGHGEYSQRRGKMGEIGNIFDNMYRQFILRDLFAKIAPGSIMLLSTSFLFSPSISQSFGGFSRLSFWLWMIILVAAWIIGFVVQHGGIIFGIIKDRTYSYRKEAKKGKTDEIKKTFSDKIDTHFLEKAQITMDAGQEFNRVLERIVVIKEACGNWSIALGYSALVLLVRFFLCLSANYKYVPLYAYLFLSLVLGCIVLNLAHRFHFDREGWFKDAYFKYKKKEIKGTP
jgi:hypothetical protein